MKITKKNKSIKATTDPINQELVLQEMPPAGEEVAKEACKYANALELISAAIESLAEIARDDQIAKDSIANLGVVMLDLKGGCQ